MILQLKRQSRLVCCVSNYLHCVQMKAWSVITRAHLSLSTRYKYPIDVACVFAAVIVAGIVFKPAEPQSC